MTMSLMKKKKIPDLQATLVDEINMIDPDLEWSTSQSSSQFTSQSSQQTMKPEKAQSNGLHPLLQELKLSYQDRLAWGTKCYASNDGRVLQMVWKDSSLVLFMSTISLGDDPGESEKPTFGHRPQNQGDAQ
jgi:hypothetical protein